MKLGAENKRQLIMLGVAAFVLIGVAAYEFLDFSSAPPTPAPVAATPAPQKPVANAPTSGSPAPRANVPAGAQAKMVASTGGQLDPTLHEDAMLVTESLVYSGNGRNIFSAISAPPPVKIEAPVAPARTQVAQNGPPPPPPGPPPPPPIDLKFFGVVTSQNGRRQAFLLHEDKVFLASAGDIVMLHYKVISLQGNAIEIEDMPNNNRQTLPLQAN